MCGLAGIWAPGQEGATGAMLSKLEHRGPDGSGIHSGKKGALGHCRLAIMDPEGGRQPLIDANRRRALAAIGEIYNYPALREELDKFDPCLTGSDSECILRLYGAMGSRVLGRLKGMYALALDDDGDLFLARDPLGIKPLYYGFVDDALVFASELKAFAPSAEGVREFPPGTYYHSRHGFHRFAQISFSSPPSRASEEWMKLLRAELELAVKNHLMSDVPVGIFLSGGLDSSLIAALASKDRRGIHTFSAGLKGSPDLAAARKVADHLGTTHHEAVFTSADIVESLPDIIYHLESFDQDLVRSAVPCWFVSKLASKHVKVVLTGEGADELFAGYRYHADIEDEEELEKELRRSVAGLHNINLQRVDRMTMAHGVEGRVPFLDMGFVALALEIPVGLKISKQSGGKTVEKWILRQAFEALLPDEILWRSKEQFDEGSGVIPGLREIWKHWFTDGQAQEYLQEHREAGLRSYEEAAYHRLLSQGFNGSRILLSNVARWAQRGRAGGAAGA